MFDHSQPPHVQQWQQIRNAVPIPANWTAHEDGVPVHAHIEWEHDDVEQITGRATRWTHKLVYVEWIDPRLPTTGAWLAATDVWRY